MGKGTGSHGVGDGVGDGVGNSAGRYECSAKVIAALASRNAARASCIAFWNTTRSGAAAASNLADLRIPPPILRNFFSMH